jgi:hypothetical protein
VNVVNLAATLVPLLVLAMVTNPVQTTLGRAFFGNDHLASTLGDEEGFLFFYLAHILQLVPSPKHKLVEQFLFTAFSYFKERERLDTLLGNNIPYTPDLPNSNKYRVLHYEGKNALLPNLQHPKIHVRNDHAFSHPSNVICYHLAYGSEVHAPFPVYEDGSPMDYVGLEQQCADPYHIRSLEETPVYAKIFLPIARSRWRHPCVLCTLWSDDFEPNSVRNNRSSVWILTMTILVSEHVQSKEHFATFPIAVGPKGSDHVPVRRAISDNIFAMSPEVCPGGVDFHNHRPSLGNIIQPPRPSRTTSSYWSNGWEFYLPR